MEEFHQQAAAAARSVLGPAEYDAQYAAGASCVRRRLDAHAAGGPLRIEIPLSGALKPSGSRRGGSVGAWRWWMPRGSRAY